MTACQIPEKNQQCGPVWVRAVVTALLVGYLLFAHGCHGDEDNELLDALPAVQGVAKPN
jgi:hypothetical protein